MLNIVHKKIPKNPLVPTWFLLGSYLSRASAKGGGGGAEGLKIGGGGAKVSWARFGSNNAVIENRLPFHGQEKCYLYLLNGKIKFRVGRKEGEGGSIVTYTSVMLRCKITVYCGHHIIQWWANLDQTPNDLEKTIFRDLSPTPLP